MNKAKHTKTNFYYVSGRVVIRIESIPKIEEKELIDISQRYMKRVTRAHNGDFAEYSIESFVPEEILK